MMAAPKATRCFHPPGRLPVIWSCLPSRPENASTHAFSLRAPRRERHRRRRRNPDFRRSSNRRTARISATCSQCACASLPFASCLACLPAPSCPRVGSSSPHSILMVVVLPAPFAPRSPYTSPLRIWRLTFFTAVNAPNSFISSVAPTAICPRRLGVVLPSRETRRRPPFCPRGAQLCHKCVFECRLIDAHLRRLRARLAPSIFANLRLHFVRIVHQQVQPVAEPLNVNDLFAGAGIP